MSWDAHQLIEWESLSADNNNIEEKQDAQYTQKSKHVIFALMRNAMD